MLPKDRLGSKCEALVKNVFRSTPQHQTFDGVVSTTVSCQKETNAPQHIIGEGWPARSRSSEGIVKTEGSRHDGLRLETIITRYTAPGYVLVRSHEHQPASVDRNDIRLIQI